MVATPYHCHFCFDVLSSHLNGQDPIEPPFEDDEYPLFVTWNIKRNGTLRLRGCIGNFTPLSLHSGLKEYALTSAFGDRRFSPITGRELTQLSCGVSLLTEFEDAEDYLDWELGTHGMYITFLDPYTNHKRTATYLPDVPPSQGWTKVETIDSLVAKAGYYGRIDDDLRENISLRRYQSSKCEVDWDEYVVWKAQLEDKSRKITSDKSKKTKVETPEEQEDFIDDERFVDDEDDDRDVDGDSDTDSGANLKRKRGMGNSLLGLWKN